MPILLALVLTGCTPDGKPPVGEDTCDDVVAAPLAGCFTSPTITPAEDGSIDGSVTGTVQSIAAGSYPSDCTTSFGGDPGATTFVLEVVDVDGVVTTVGLGGFAPPVAEGDTVTLELAYDMSSFGPEQATVRIRDTTGAEVLVYADGGAVPDLSAPAGVTLAMGDTICTEADSCGDWFGSDLAVTAGGETVSVPYGGSAEVGGWSVTHGGLDEQVDGQTTCPDYFVAHAEVGFAAM